MASDDEAPLAHSGPDRKKHHVSDPAQQWDDILADLLVECGHCHAPMSPLPPTAAEPRYSCLQEMYPACTEAAMPALELEDYVAYQVLGEMAKPAVAEALTQVLLQFLDTDLASGQGERAAVRALADVPAEEAEAIRRNLTRYMDEDTFSPRWLADWWNRRAARVPHRKRQLCRAFLTKVELRAGPAPAPGALYDDRIVLHWKVWENPPDSISLREAP
ncbi:hypothetical protein GCM10010344_70810 [Streptomyces bluensis]|nr:hypothetical protein GCM10010344_70810 [Streptomyces bluensis]